MKITAILKGVPDNQGRLPVVIRTANGKTRSFQSTQIRLQPRQLKDGKVIGHPQAATLNQLIKKIIADKEIEALTGRMELPAVSFHKYAEGQLQAWERVQKPETIRSYTNDFDKFKEFAPDATITGTTPALLERYQAYLYDIGNTTNTQWKAFKFIRKIILRAIKDKLLTMEQNPFLVFDAPKYKDPKKKYLTKDQVDRIERFAIETPSLELAFCANWFVISCYTGLRYSDMKAFNIKDHIRDNRLIVHTVKTGEIVSMPVSSRLRSLLDRVGWKGMHYTNQAYNELLKSIAALCNIDINITAHLSRHTAAMMWANAGLSEEVVSKLLGHSNMRSVRVYFKISNLRIDDELKRLGL